MEIQLSEKMVRGMATRLRTELGTTDLKQSQALELVSHLMGLKNWDTLSGMLKKPKADASAALNNKFKKAGIWEKTPTVDTPFMLYIDAFSCDAFDSDGPGWMRVEVTQAFVDNLWKQQRLCVTHSLGETIGDEFWGETWDNNENLRIHGDDLYVSTKSFWFRGIPKHWDTAVESRMFDIAELFNAIASPGIQTEFTGWADGILFHDGASAQNFARSLLDDDVIQVEESRIDRMLSNTLR